MTDYEVLVINRYNRVMKKIERKAIKKFGNLSEVKVICSKDIMNCIIAYQHSKLYSSISLPFNRRIYETEYNNVLYKVSCAPQLDKKTFYIL